MNSFTMKRSGCKSLTADRKILLALCLVIFLPALGFSWGPPEPTLITFDPPGSVFTYPGAINPAGAITGYYAGPDWTHHGFLRDPDGSFTTFDVPGAHATTPLSINPAGAITGDYGDGGFSGSNHGFLRAPDGTITTFDPPGSVNTLGALLGINPAGAITGYYTDGTLVDIGSDGPGPSLYHGFLRDPDGSITTFDFPGAHATKPLNINPAGAITGIAIRYYWDEFAKEVAGTLVAGFLRDPDGSITNIALFGSVHAIPYSINPAGEITGLYYDANTNLPHGFLRNKDGSYTSFDVPGSFETRPFSINPAGEIVGTYQDNYGIFGFMRARDGSFTVFAAGPGDTSAYGNNPAGEITGINYLGVNDQTVSHGFLLSHK